MQVAELEAADIEAFAHFEDEAVNGIGLGNMLEVEDVPDHELMGKSVLEFANVAVQQAEVEAVG